jgi:hypothetical protein
MWVIVGLWIERRAGSLRLAAWTVAGVGASLAAHAVMHPEHDLLLGLSAVLFVVCTAGLTGYALDEWPGRVALLGVVAVLVHERLSGGTIAADMFSGVGWGEPVELVAHRGRAEPVPDVHLACALVGVELGVLCRVGKPEKLACRRGPRGSGAAVTL